MTDEQIKELITRRRRQVLVHSVIYYRWNENVITDSKFDRWSNELHQLQQKHPELAAQCIYHDEFKDFDGSSGFDLPLNSPEILNSANRVLKYHKEKR